jgi:serine/threonine-protein kinase
MAEAKSSDVAFDQTQLDGDLTQATEHTAPQVDQPRLQRGMQVGRYLVLDVLGAGGMGVVYSAYDPELDRKLAIKLVQARGAAHSREEQRAWVLREAQALARLSHPNVIAVHDLGTLDDDRVFVAMELVQGVTLRKWLEQPRTWREIVPVMMAAGLGLSAAHAVGLVHRDFKPENVIVGADGRTRVMDFGLARLRREGFDEETARVSDMNIDARSPLSQELTVHGAIIGTPAYVAPEIYAGKVADARSDQYGFGITLYYALYHSVPYDLQAVVEGTAKPPRLPSTPDVPPWLQKVVMRAIAIAPADRYESMDALLRELAVAPKPRRRIFLAIGGATIALAALLAVLSRGGTEVCTGAEQRLVGVWDPAAKKLVHDAYAASKLPYAERAFTGLERGFDRYAHDWVAMSFETCQAARVRRDQTEEVMTLREACLGRRLVAIRALVRELADQPSPEIIAKADAPVAALDPIEACADVETLRRPGQAASDPRILFVTEQLAEANAKAITGRFMPAMVETQKLLDLADATGYGPVQAMAHRTRATAMLGVGDLEGGVHELETAARLALASNRDDLAAQLSLYAAMFLAEGLKRKDEARVWLDVGLAEAARVPPSDQVELAKQSAIGMVQSANGDRIGAVAAHRRMLEVATHMYGMESYSLLSAETQLATSLNRASMFAESVDHYRRALALAEGIVGPDHPGSAVLYANLGTGLGKLGKLEESRKAYDHALELFEKAYGPAHPMLIVTLNNIADNLNINGDPTSALEPIDRAMKIARPLGDDSVFYQTAATTRGEILTAAHRFAEARAQLEEILPAEQRMKAAGFPVTLAARAELALAEKAWPDAVLFAQRSIEQFESMGGNDNPDLWRPLSVLGRAEIELGKKDDARTHLQRALAIGDKLQLAPTALDATKAALTSLR